MNRIKAAMRHLLRAVSPVGKGSLKRRLARVAKFCQKCGEANASDQKTCVYCGKLLQ